MIIGFDSGPGILLLGAWSARHLDQPFDAGGARNSALMKLLTEQLAGKNVATIDALGVNAEHVEALAFAWLAYRAMNCQPGNLPSATGAHAARILGALYRA